MRVRLLRTYISCSLEGVNTLYVYPTPIVESYACAVRTASSSIWNIEFQGVGVIGVLTAIANFDRIGCEKDLGVEQGHCTGA